jgi:16S rRNA processing protein RimM
VAGLNLEDFITLARVARTQGRRGEVAVEVHSDVPERLRAGMRVFALAAGRAAESGSKPLAMSALASSRLPRSEDARRELQIEDAWPHKSYVVLKFAGVDSISDAEPLVGSELQVPLSERAALQAGAAYVSDLIGCAVFDLRVGDQGREVGIVRDVRFGAGEAPLLVVAGKVEYEIPYAQEFLVRIDLGKKRIEMALPEGLLEVNAPLTDLEKQEQQQKR